MRRLAFVALLLPALASAQLVMVSGGRGSSSGGDPGDTQTWAQRISGASVVWYHGFENEAEVDRFRWAGGYMCGNDPSKAASAASTMTYYDTGGPGDGPYFDLYRPPGSGGGGVDNYYWWRMMSPLTGASNGRGIDDPAASGTISLQTFSPSDGGCQMQDWDQKTAPGYYGKLAYAAAGTGDPATYSQKLKTFDGDEFYFQMQARAYAARMLTGNGVNGKFLNFSLTKSSYSAQELVTVSAYPTPSSPSGGPYQANIFNMYEGGFGYMGSGAVSSPITIDNADDPQWAWAADGTWDTILYRVKPGTYNPTGDEPLTRDAELEVWAQHHGETEYTQIFDVRYRGLYDNTEEFARDKKWAFNAVIAWIYQNGVTYPGEVRQDFARFIFSKAFIPPAAVETF